MHLTRDEAATVLGVAVGSSQTEIRAAYKVKRAWGKTDRQTDRHSRAHSLTKRPCVTLQRLGGAWHPDKNSTPQATQIFQRILAAYETLSSQVAPPSALTTSKP